MSDSVSFDLTARKRLLVKIQPPQPLLASRIKVLPRILIPMNVARYHGSQPPSYPRAIVPTLRLAHLFMSHTTRRDPIDTAKHTPDFMMPFGLGVISCVPTKKEMRVAHQDGKKRFKPGRAAKAYLSKGAKAKTRRALAAVVEEPDEAPMPREVRSHVWDYN